MTALSASTLQRDAFLPRAPVGIGRGLLLDLLGLLGLRYLSLTGRIFRRTTPSTRDVLPTSTVS
jgi:hypothetical protein